MLTAFFSFSISPTRYFSQIDEQLLTEVLEIYQLDFELFGYNSTKYYSYVQETMDDG